METVKNQRFNFITVTDANSNPHFYADGNGPGGIPYTGSVRCTVHDRTLYVEEHDAGKLHIFADGQWHKVDAE